MRVVLLILLVIPASVSIFGLGVYVGYTHAWPVSQMKMLVGNASNPDILMDQFGRLQRYPGKTEIACPAQDEATAVLLVAGQSNAANSQGQRYQSPDDRVVNFSEGH